MKEKLGFGYMGNGVTVYDSNRTENNDYVIVAHISYEREVRYYYDLSHEAKVKIENFAKYGNMTPTVQPDMYALKPFKGSYRLSKEEKDSFLRDHECHTDGIESFINRIWDNKDTPYENLEYFRWWWNTVQSDEVRLDETEGDTVDIYLTPEKTPVAFYRKIRCLMSSGMTEEEATKEAYQTPIQLELLYDIGVGLFGVESDAVDSCEIYNPYSGKEVSNNCLAYPDSPSE